MATFPDFGSEPVTASSSSGNLAPTSDFAEASAGADESGLPDPARPLADRFGKYRVERLLGRGGFGDVYLARDDELARFVAIKVARPDRWKDDEQKRFVDEARRLARLDHPGIVRVYQIDAHGGMTYVVSEYVDGEDLNSWARRRKPAPEEIAKLLACLCDAVAFAHSQGIWHRDIKPSNVLIDRSGSPKLIDFGLATDDVAQRSLAGETAGTLPYMSPEQVNGEAHRLDGRSDIWSIGVLLYELLSGSRPFSGDSESSLCDEIRMREPRPLRMIAPRTPLELVRICTCCLAKRAIDRYQSAYDLAEDLRHWLKSQSDGSLPESSRRAAVRTSGDPDVSILPKGLHSFDAEDADFFLDLLPGPRDREGLPQRVRFWKRRIQERQASETFAVGVMYGPSGCGKSSLVKAGLIPRLGHDVNAIYVEASGSDTEKRLIEAIRRRCPEAVGGGLVDLFGRLRRNGASYGRKALIVLDQFEQWLHAQRDLESSELVRALRQCDGGRLQCLILVRDDFWMPVSRFMRALEVELAEGTNAAAVDLFDETHATKVLTAFGRAWDRLPPATGELTDAQRAFLSSAVRGLSQDGKVVCVRLVIFAETMKTRLWTASSLAALGGASGVQASFLDEMFRSPNAPPAHRLLAEGAKAVLAALTPEEGVEIRNRTRTYGELFDEFRMASPRSADQEGFQTLLNVLSVDLRLIAVAQTPYSEDRDDAEQKRYQLTHDFLVPSLRDWLDREQRRTWRGRTEALLAERTASWRVKREPRHLVSLPEWISSLFAIDFRRLPKDQREFVRAATSYYAVRVAAWTALFLVVVGAGWLFAANASRTAARDRAQSALTQLRHADVSTLPAALREVANNRTLVEPQLKELAQSNDFDARWRAALALLPDDPSHADTLHEALFDDRLRAEEFAFILNELKPYHAATSERAERRIQQSAGYSLRAAAALAQVDPDSAALAEYAGAANAELFAADPDESAEWRRLLRPAASRFSADAERRFFALSEPAELRNAAGAIRAFSGEGISALIALLPFSSDPQAQAIVEEVRETDAANAKEAIVREYERLPESLPELDARRAAIERELANLAVTAFRLGDVDPLVKFLATGDWDRRAHAKAAFAGSGISVAEMVEALSDPRLASARFALLPSSSDPQAEAIVEEVREPDTEHSKDAIVREYERLQESLPELDARRAAIERELANLAVAAYCLGDVSPLAESLATDDWGRRAHAVGAFAGSGISVAEMVDALNDPRFASARFGLLSALAERNNDVRSSERSALIERILPFYSDASDGGVHSAARLVLRRLGAEPDAIPSPGDERIAVETVRPGEWFRTGLSHEMIAFECGGRTVAMGAEEVSVAQFRQFDPAAIRTGTSPRGDSAAVGDLDPYDFVRYCQWLSEASLPESEWCYPPLAQLTRDNLRPVDGYLDRTGYRLPTPEEWRTACLAGAPAHPFRDGNETLGPRYAWYLSASNGEVRATGTLLPNRYGFFDTYGNVREACASPDGDGSVFVICGSTAKAAPSVAFASWETGDTPLFLGGDPCLGLRIARTLKNDASAEADPSRSPRNFDN